MTSGRLPVSKTVKVPRKCSIKTGPNGVQNFTKKSSRLNHEAQGDSLLSLSLVFLYLEIII